SRFTKRLNVPQGYASPLRSLRPCWTAFLSILSLFRPQHHTESFNCVFRINRVFPQPVRLGRGVTRNGKGRHFISPSNQKSLPTSLFRRTGISSLRYPR